MSILPCIVTIGLSGSGKSASNIWIEQYYQARRVRRFTTRPRRADDDCKLVVNLKRAEIKPGDFVYHGWNETTYWIQKADIDYIRTSGHWPLVELGDPIDGARFKEQFTPTYLICLWRGQVVESMRQVLAERKMDETEIGSRVATIEEDLKELKRNHERFDFSIHNDKSMDDLAAEWNRILKRLKVGLKRDGIGFI